MLVDEFNQYRGLFPLKILINGPPASGKTHFSKLIAHKYGIPHIRIEDLIDLSKDLQDDLGD